MDALTTCDFAGLANAVYADEVLHWAGFTRQSYMFNGLGFAAALYTRKSGAKTNFVLSYAGTDRKELDDWRADAGFAGINFRLLSQITGALEAVAHSRRFSQRDPLVLTGHSLGGGLAQIIAAFTGLPAVTFSAPTVSSVPNVEKAYLRDKPKIVNFRILNDPVNCSEVMGHRIGAVITLLTPRSIATAHQMENTLAELQPHGSLTYIGERDPFSIPTTRAWKALW
jgi:hypothetical protein